MTWALLGLVALLVGSNITTGVWYHGADRDKDAALLLLDGTRKELAEVRHDLEVETANHKTHTDELAATKKLLAEKQLELKQAWSNARDHFVHRLETAGIADAARLVSDLVALDLRPAADGVLPPRRSDDPEDGLLPLD